MSEVPGTESPRAESPDAGSFLPTLSDEDAKLLTLARGARGRIGALAGASVRDETGRTYSGATVSLESLRLSAVQVAVAQAVASGANSLEAVVVVSSQDLADEDVMAIRDLAGAGVPIYVANPDASLRTVTST